MSRRFLLLAASAALAAFFAPGAFADCSSTASGGTVCVEVQPSSYGTASSGALADVRSLLERRVPLLLQDCAVGQDATSCVFSVDWKNLRDVFFVSFVLLVVVLFVFKWFLKGSFWLIGIIR